jgi:hypothetical protein
MRVLDGLADRYEKLEALAGSELVGVAVFGDRYAVHQFHDEVGPAAVAGTGVEDSGDVRVVRILNPHGTPLGQI